MYVFTYWKTQEPLTQENENWWVSLGRGEKIKDNVEPSGIGAFVMMNN